MNEGGAQTASPHERVPCGWIDSAHMGYNRKESSILKSKHISNFILILMLLVGLCLLLYPSFANLWNSINATKAITNYDEAVIELDEADYTAYWNSAYEYNGLLNQRNDVFRLTDQMLERYNTELDVMGNGVMTYVNIPKLNVNLPVYHGSDEAVLQVAVGHLEWSSLPVGGESTHCVVSGHRGLPSAKLFTELDKMEIGDTFTLKTLGETLTYQVDQILIVEPTDVEPLYIVEGEDYCTLLTCTPYGINSHRMLVRGTRIENVEEEQFIRVTADAALVEPVLVAPLVAAPMLLILLIIVLIPKRKNRREDL